MDEYTDEEIIIIDDFGADSMQFNELLILLGPYLTALAPARYRNKVYSVSFSNHNFARTNRKLVFHDTRRCNAAREKTRILSYK